jgi:dihydroneopterin aldolase
MEVVIKVEGIRIWARHGVYAEEQVNGRYFLVDVSVVAELDDNAIRKDELSATVNYEAIHHIVQEVMIQPQALLEKLALGIGEQVKSFDKRIQKVSVKVSKLHPPLGGEVAATAVEIQL